MCQQHRIAGKSHEKVHLNICSGMFWQTKWLLLFQPVAQRTHVLRPFLQTFHGLPYKFIWVLQYIASRFSIQQLLFFSFPCIFSGLWKSTSFRCQKSEWKPMKTPAPSSSCLQPRSQELVGRAFEPRKDPSYLPLYWLFSRDPFGLL